MGFRKIPGLEIVFSFVLKQSAWHLLKYTINTLITKNLLWLSKVIVTSPGVSSSRSEGLQLQHAPLVLSEVSPRNVSFHRALRSTSWRWVFPCDLSAFEQRYRLKVEGEVTYRQPELLKTSVQFPLPFCSTQWHGITLRTEGDSLICPASTQSAVETSWGHRGRFKFMFICEGTD